MRIEDILGEVFTSGDVDTAIKWNETPADVRDSHTGEPSKLPIVVPDEYREDKKKKKKLKKKKNYISESDSINRQEKFAQENFVGLDEIGEELLHAIKTVEQMWKEAHKNREKDEEKFYSIYGEIDDYIKSKSPLFVVLNIKLSNSLGHALNGNSTKTLRKIINFMDKYGINDSVIHRDMARVAQTRSFNSNSILDLCTLVAAQVDDYEFVKEIEAFAEKNKDRKNLYKRFGYTNKNIGDMTINSMTQITNYERFGFEALVNGSKTLYQYFGKKQELSKDYILHHIIKDSYWTKRLTKIEVNNVIQLEPDLFNDILENMPENLPDYLVDIFIF